MNTENHIPKLIETTKEMYMSTLGLDKENSSKQIAIELTGISLMVIINTDGEVMTVASYENGKKPRYYI